MKYMFLCFLLTSCTVTENNYAPAIKNEPLAGCNVQVIKCNCEKPQVNMGEIMPSNLCQSGKQRLYFCEEDCGQWFYWTAYCYCE